MSPQFTGVQSSVGFSPLLTYCSKTTQLAGPLLEKVLASTKIFIKGDSIGIKSEEFSVVHKAQVCVLIKGVKHVFTLVMVTCISALIG